MSEEKNSLSLGDSCEQPYTDSDDEFTLQWYDPAEWTVVMEVWSSRMDSGHGSMGLVCEAALQDVSLRQSILCPDLCQGNVRTHVSGPSQQHRAMMYRVDMPACAGWPLLGLHASLGRLHYWAAGSATSNGMAHQLRSRPCHSHVTQTRPAHTHTHLLCTALYAINQQYLPWFCCWQWLCKRSTADKLYTTATLSCTHFQLDLLEIIFIVFVAMMHVRAVHSVQRKHSIGKLLIAVEEGVSWIC